MVLMDKWTKNAVIKQVKQYLTIFETSPAVGETAKLIKATQVETIKLVIDFLKKDLYYDK